MVKFPWFAAAFGGTAIVPDFGEGLHNPRNLKVALRDPDFAREFNRKLARDAAVYVITILSILAIFLGIGILLLR